MSAPSMTTSAPAEPIRACLTLEHVQADRKGGGLCHTVMARLVRATYRGRVLVRVARTSRAMTNRVFAPIPVSLKMP
jgi:hypothetical protein